MFNLQRQGFTLAEVLITLVVIGIVASLTIPVLIQKTNQAEYVTALKNNYSVLSQVVERLKNDNAGSLVGAFQNANQTRDAFAKYLSVVKTCNGSGNCWPNVTYGYDGSDMLSYSGFSTSPSLTLNNGLSISFNYSQGSANCTSTWTTTPGVEYPPGKVCSLIYIDTNGLKPPNTWGKDIFEFWLLKDRLVPVGTAEDMWGTAGNICSTSDKGRGCAAYYLKGNS